MKSVARARGRTFTLCLGAALAGAWAMPVACTDDDPAPSTPVIEAGSLDANEKDAKQTDAGPAIEDAATQADARDAQSGSDASDGASDADGAPEASVDAAAVNRILYLDTSNIWVMDADGTNKSKITNTLSVNYGNPAWSPDRTKIAFNSDQDDGSGEIYVMDANGSNVVRLTTDVGESDVEPAWSPDGSKIAFASRRDHQIGSIYVMDAQSGANVLRVTNSFPASDESPSWSPTNKIAFWTNEGGIGLHIAVIDLNLGSPPDGGADGGAAWGTGRTGFPGNVALGLFPSWSPSGTKIAYAGDGSGARHIFVMNPDGTGQTSLTSSGLAEEHPTWSPDGTRIAFDRNVGGHMEIFAINANGTGEVALTPADAGVGGGTDPHW